MDCKGKTFKDTVLDLVVRMILNFFFVSAPKTAFKRLFACLLTAEVSMGVCFDK
ncbi:MAG: hypothetical protein JRJ41_11840 [Deltaproteobacteria bacterium]|nr:hypothetical protein [Deltaproteobacteria bacterium]